MRIALLLIALWALCSCGGQQIPVADAADLALDTVTDSAQPMYEGVKAFCSAQEWAIVDSDRTASQKEAAVLKVRQKCDEIFALFDTIIRLQQDARVIVDASRNGEADALAALSRVKEVQALLAEAGRLFQELRGSP